ncbi:MAG: hypothetical protein ACRETN_01040 [Nevskiales bacterium]
MNTASRLAQALVLVGLGAISAAHAENTHKPMRAIAIVDDSSDSIAGFCHQQIRNNLITHGYRVVSPSRADVILNVYGSEDHHHAVYLRRAYHSALHHQAETTDDEADDVAEEINDILEDIQPQAQTYEYRLIYPATGEELAYGGKYEKSGSPAGNCRDIADDIADEIKKSLRSHMITRREPARSFQPVMSDRTQDERAWEFYQPY